MRVLSRQFGSREAAKPPRETHEGGGQWSVFGFKFSVFGFQFGEPRTGVRGCVGLACEFACEQGEAQKGKKDGTVDQQDAEVVGALGQQQEECDDCLDSDGAAAEEETGLH